MEDTNVDKGFRDKVAMARLNAMKMRENMEETTVIKAFRVKLAMARLNVMKRSASSETQNPLTFDISGLPLPVKKHIITAGIIQGDIFQYGDGFACIKEGIPSQAKSTSGKILHLQVQALSPKSYEMALGIIETLLDEVLEPQKKTIKRLMGFRSWPAVVTNEFEILSLMKPVISHLITKGIIKGDIHQCSGAVVSARGNPYLVEDSPQEAQSERPIYLLIQGPTDIALYWAADRIQKLIKEAEEIINNDIPEVISEERVQLNEVAVSHELKSDVTTPGVNVVHQQHQPQVQSPPFMPQLGQTVEAAVERCTLLVHWLMAHPLMVSFMACPPPGCHKTISKKMATAALLCLPIYDRYECRHVTPNQTCSHCREFASKAQKAVSQCCETVATSGYDISKLISVDDYIKNLAADPGQIGVLYDYPLPLNLFYIDNCRFFIDLAINFGLEIGENHIRWYLKSTNQWYPVEAFQKIIESRVNRCPSKNPKTHNYPSYFSLDHHGGLINFHLETIGNASPGRLFPADAPKIPRCKDFPYLQRLSVFSKLYNYNRKYMGEPEKQTDEMNDSISFAAYQLTHSQPQGSFEGSTSSTATTAPSQPSLNNPFWNNQNLLGNPQNASGSSMRQYFDYESKANTSQNAFPNSQNLPTSLKPQLEDGEPTRETQKLQGRVPPAFITMQKSKEKPTSSSNPLRIHRKEKRKQLRELEKIKIEEEKKKEKINEAIETIRAKHGTNNFWTMQHTKEVIHSEGLEVGNSKEKLEKLSTEQTDKKLLAEQTESYNMQFGSTQPPTPALPLVGGSTFSQNLQEALGNMQLSMPALQTTVFGAQLPMLMGLESNFILKPALLNVKGQPPGQDDSQLHQDSVQSNPFSDVISQLENYIQSTTDTKAESEDPPTILVDEETSARPQQSSDTVLQSKSSDSAVQQDTAIGDSAQDSPFSAIIQQLQQFIDSNSQTTSEDDLKREPPADQFKKPLEAISIKKTTGKQQTSKDNLERKQNSSQLKHSSSENTSESVQAKRLCTENSITKPTTPATKSTSTKQTITFTNPTTPATKPTTTKQTISFAKPTTPATKPTTTKQTISFAKPTTPATKPVSTNPIPESFPHRKNKSRAKKPGYGKEVFASQQPSTSVQQNIEPPSKKMSSVSLLGDCLLQRARTHFGGMADRDRRKDSFTINDLREDVITFHNKGGQLKPYCLIMCGANDVIQHTSPKHFVTQLKILLNYLQNKGYHVILVTLPLVVSNVEVINKAIPTINGLILSFHTKANLSIIPFHKVFEEYAKEANEESLLKSIHTSADTITQSHNVVLSDLGCVLIRLLVEKEVPMIP